MDLVILGMLNVVLIVLLLVALKLIRSGGSKSVEPMSAVNDAASVSDDAVIDLRDGTAATPPSPAMPNPAMPVYGDPVFAADGTPLPDGVFEAPNRTEAPNAPSAEPPPFPSPIGSSGSMNSLSRSAIVIDSSLNGSGPTPSELLFSVIETLGSIGFELTKDSPDYGLLKDADDNTASIDLTKRPNGTDRIAIAVDSPRAVESLAMLEIWHRSRLGASDQVRLSARIR